MALIFLRSLVFNVLFYFFLVLWILFAIPTFLMPRKAILTVAGWWAKSNLLLMRLICGTKVEFRGVENPDAVWRRGYRVPGRGVGRLDVRPAEWGLPLDQPFRFTCRFDRRTPHRKPILFRRFADGSLSGNHS